MMTDGAVTVAFDLAEDLLAVASTALAGTPVGAPLRRFVAEGEAAFDCTSQLSVQLLRLAPAAEFPNEGRPPLYGSGRSPGPADLLGLYEVLVLRCAATAPKGGPPAVEQITASAKTVLTDAVVLRRALECAVAAGERPAVVGAWVPVGPEGGAVGGRVTVTFEITGCACP